MMSSAAELVANACWKRQTESSTQLVVMSAGLDEDGVLASIAFKCFEAHAAKRRELSSEGLSVKPLFFVVVPDYVSSAQSHYLRSALQLAVADAWKNTTRLSECSSNVAVVEEGASPKERSDLYFSGGLVVINGRFFCADVLHKRIDLHASTVGAVFRVPSCERHAASPRRVAKQLPSMAFALELITARNLELNAKHYLSSDVSAAAPVFVLSDYVKAMSYCLTAAGAAALDGATFVEAFHVGDVQVFPRFRLDLIRHFEDVAKRQHLPLSMEMMEVPESPLDITLERILNTILGETLAELQSLEKRLSSPAQELPQTGRAAKHHRVEDKALPDSRWRDASKPCGVSFAALTLRDALDGAKNGLLPLLQDATRLARAALAPYVSLLAALEDLVYLCDQAVVMTPGAFLMTLEDTVSSGRQWRQQQRGVGSGAWGGKDAPLWTLSEHFASLITVASHRVFKLSVPSKNVAVNVDADENVLLSNSDDDVVEVFHHACKQDDKPTQIVPPDGCQSVLAVTKQVVSSWISSVARKLSRRHNQQNESAMEQPVMLLEAPSLLVLVEGDATVRRLARYFVSSATQFAQYDLQRFIVHYQAIHCHRSQRSRPDASAAPDEEELGPANTNGSDNEDDDDNIERDEADVAKRMTQSMTARTQVADVSVLQSAHTLLVSQCVSSLPDETSLLLSGLEHVDGRNSVAYSCVGLCEGSAVLRGSVAAAGDASVAIRICNVRKLTPRHLLQFLTDGTDASSAQGGARLWDSAAAVRVPPFGRVVVPEPTLRTLRMLESLQDLYHRNCERGGAGTLGPVRVQLLRRPGGSGESDRSSELDLETQAFQRIIAEKSKLTETLFCSRAAMEEVEADLSSARVGSRQRDADFQRGDDSSKNMLLPMTLRLRPAKKNVVDKDNSAPVQQQGASAARKLIVFDEREFRCMLPYQLFRRGFDVVPLTLLQGDYVIAARYAIERKAPADLAQSLWSGRLMTQLQSLTRHFPHPVLLIEFARALPFRLRSSSRTFESDTSLLLYRRFASALVCNPSVHVVWSRSGAHTAALCYKIRTTAEDAGGDPEPSDASLTQRKEGEEAADTMYAVRVLRGFPGIDASNVSAVMDAAGSLAGLAGLPLAALERAMGPVKAKLLHTFLHKNLTERIE